jgi:hypothetical protein
MLGSDRGGSGSTIRNLRLSDISSRSPAALLPSPVPAFIQQFDLIAQLLVQRPHLGARLLRLDLGFLTDRSEFAGHRLTHRRESTVHFLADGSELPPHLLADGSELTAHLLTDGSELTACLLTDGRKFTQYLVAELKKLQLQRTETPIHGSDLRRQTRKAFHGHLQYFQAFVMFIARHGASTSAWRLSARRVKLWFFNASVMPDEDPHRETPSSTWRLDGACVDSIQKRSEGVPTALRAIGEAARATTMPSSRHIRQERIERMSTLGRHSRTWADSRLRRCCLIANPNDRHTVEAYVEVRTK